MSFSLLSFKKQAVQSPSPTSGSRVINKGCRCDHSANCALLSVQPYLKNEHSNLHKKEKSFWYLPLAFQKVQVLMDRDHGSLISCTAACPWALYSNELCDILLIDCALKISLALKLLNLMIWELDLEPNKIISVPFRINLLKSTCGKKEVKNLILKDCLISVSV